MKTVIKTDNLLFKPFLESLEKHVRLTIKSYT